MNIPLNMLMYYMVLIRVILFLILPLVNVLITQLVKLRSYIVVLKLVLNS